MYVNCTLWVHVGHKINIPSEKTIILVWILNPFQGFFILIGLLSVDVCLSWKLGSFCTLKIWGLDFCLRKAIPRDPITETENGNGT